MTRLARPAIHHPLARFVVAFLLAALVAACGSKGATPGGGSPSVVPDDRGIYAAASLIRICQATSSGVGQAAHDLAAAADVGDLDRVHALGGILRSAATDLEKTSKQSMQNLQVMPASSATKGAQQDALALFQRCVALGQQGEDVAAAADAVTSSAGTDLGALATQATQVDGAAQSVNADVTTFANELPHP